MLTEIAKDIWIAEGEIVNFYGFAYPTRSVIVRLPSNGLWVWSPVRLTAQLQFAIEQLGHPKHLVSPNKIHHLYLGEWSTAYPGAKLWGPASTIRKRSDLTFEKPLEDACPAEWEGAFDQVWFRGSRVMDEIVFFHRGSSTAILADLSENFSDEFIRNNWIWWQRWIAPMWGIVEGKGYAPLEWRLSFFDRASTRNAVQRVLTWNPERVIMAHGEWQSSEGRRFLEKAFHWTKTPA
ncbi:DUF4336 domain-containing protein [Hoeflea sp. TYP-13]|uniref:DUF4336 domain-containing protein n=1 Tax=Hoeflea sp. TYP-13 TaxID=3230023 RepID=UPI0034C62D26